MSQLQQVEKASDNADAGSAGILVLQFMGVRWPGALSLPANFDGPLLRGRVS